MAEPFFTIVIPTYNRGRHLPAALDAVLSQEYTSFEVVVVDDGSTDDTADVVQRYEDSRIRYFRQENKERAAARNAGMRNARGTYVTFLDSDDLIARNHLLEAKAIADVANPSIFHLGYNVCDANGSLITPWKPLPNPANWKLLDGNYLSCMGVFLSRDVYTQFFFNEDRKLAGSEDYEFWLRLAARYNIIASPRTTGILVNHEQRSVIQTDAQKLIIRIELLKHYIKADAAFMSKFSRSVHRWEAFLDIYVALHLSLMKGMARSAQRWMFQSFRKFPYVIFFRRFWVVPYKLLFFKP